MFLKLYAKFCSLESKYNINILELLGKTDNIPFSQLYNLVEDCMDRYYTKVIKTLTQLLKSSFIDRQLVLVNTARAPKFLELYTSRQTKLCKVLSKYDRLPDHFHDLQTMLQTEFSLLKKATSKNIENLQEAVNLQQTYTTLLCSHVNSIYTKLAQLDRQIQTHCLYPHPQSDVVQINAPEYDSDIEGKLSYCWIYNHWHHRILPALKKHHHMPRTLKKIQPQSPPILKNTPPFPGFQ